MSEKTNETILVRISTEAHDLLREIADAEKRQLGRQAEVLIEAAYNAMKARQFTPVAGRVPDMTVVGQ